MEVHPVSKSLQNTAGVFGQERERSRGRLRASPGVLSLMASRRLRYPSTMDKQLGRNSPAAADWALSRCFGDKGDVEDITEGLCFDHQVSLLFASAPPQVHAYAVFISQLTPSPTQRISYLPSNSMKRVIIWPRVTKEVESFSSSAIGLYVIDPSLAGATDRLCRRRLASTSFTPSSNHTSQSSIT